MVGHLHLQAMDDSLKGKNRDGLLDSPDSGLPPSPSPPFCSLSPGPPPGQTHQDHQDFYTKDHKEGKLLPYLLLNTTGPDPRTRMYPVFFGESIEVNPKPEQEIKCNSEVKYDSDRHYRDQVYCAPVPTPTSYSETVVAVQNCTWRNYKSQVYLEPRTRPLHYRTTTIVYPKHAKSIYRTTLNYNATGSRRWFVSTVQLESGEDTSPCIIYTEDL
ncbi:unnamed protein product [Merluccius merluccius]|uniref:Refilin-A n=1 Tax=Merluccius polli TaxID=89951 RepID=A0AA47MK93_MERPO|nr:Refilin-A [Merluccius polli]